jgi:predicted AAA+ superfamily ATPase
VSVCNEIRLVSLALIESVRALQQRAFHHKVDWSERLIGVIGAKGVGKTTILLQQLIKAEKTSLYLSLDQPLVTQTSVLEIARQFYIEGGTRLYLDEVHKYPNWATELKNIYDSLPKLQVVFSGSSVISLMAQGGDLSRRAAMYTLPILSFREFLEIECALTIPAISLGDLLRNHEEYAKQICAQIKPVSFFKEYLTHGAYPFYREGTARFADKLRNAVLYTIESDLVQVHQLDPHYIPKLKKLLHLLATTVPFSPNMSALAQSLDISRATTLRYLELLELGGIIALLQRHGRGYQKIAKPEKVYLENTNLLHAFAGSSFEIGTVREIFALSQLRGAGHAVLAPSSGDLFVDDRYTFEIGGKSKSDLQLAGAENAYVLRDSIEVGSGSIVPLWVVGCIY